MIHSRAHQQPPVREHRVLLRDTTFERLQAAILEGALQPGQLLRNSELEAWLGVSRTPIREAINQLVRIGLVEMQANRYTRVAIPKPRDALVTAQAFGVIAIGILRLTIDQLDDTERADTSEALRDVAHALINHRPMDARTQALTIWTDLAAHSDNRSLQRLLEMSGAEATFRMTPSILDVAREEGRAAEWLFTLATAFETADGQAAEHAIEHIYHVPLRSKATTER